MPGGYSCRREYSSLHEVPGLGVIYDRSGVKTGVWVAWAGAEGLRRSAWIPSTTSSLASPEVPKLEGTREPQEPGCLADRIAR
jgi:hypothetical protein